MWVFKAKDIIIRKDAVTYAYLMIRRLNNKSMYQSHILCKTIFINFQISHAVSFVSDDLLQVVLFFL